MTDLRKAAEMALEALHNIDQSNNDDAIEALRQALAQPEQEWDSRHPKAQALIRERARLRIELGLVEQLVDDPHFETMPTDMEYWGPLHDKLKEALTQSVDTVNMSQERVDETAKGEHEPVAWVIEDGEVDYYVDVVAKIKPGTPLYTAPPQKRSFSEDVGRLLSTGKGFYDDGTPIDDKEIQLKIESVGDGVVTCTEVHLPRPPQKQWVGLTDGEKNELVDAFYGTDIQRLEAIEAKLKEKNT